MKEYRENYLSHFLIIGLSVFLLHGAKLNSDRIGIDTEDIINLGDQFYKGWLETGRHGLVLLKTLLHSRTFQPYFAGLMTLICLTVAVGGFFLLWERIGKDKLYDKKYLVIPGAILWISHPVMTEQLYFSLQSVEICLGIFFTALALYLTGRFRIHRKWYCFCGAVLLLLLTFSIYQVFVPLYIFGTTTVLLLHALDCGRQQKECDGKGLLAAMLPYILVFLTAFIGNTVITKCFFGTSDYLQGQIMWGKLQPMENIRAIGAQIIKSLTGLYSVHYHFSFGLLAVLSVVLVFMYVRKVKERGAKAVICFYLLSVLASPYLLVLVCGGGAVVRAQLLIPAAVGFLALLDARLLLGMQERFQEKRKAVSGGTAGKGLCCILWGVLAFALITGLWVQSRTTLALYYTDSLRYEQDVALGRELMYRIDTCMGEEEVPVVLVGTMDFKGNASCVKGETMGKSFFSQDAEAEPQYFWSTRRALGFLKTLGGEYNQLGQEQMEEAYKYSEGMPEWPAQGSVQRLENMVIVKLEMER